MYQPPSGSAKMAAEGCGRGEARGHLCKPSPFLSLKWRQGLCDHSWRRWPSPASGSRGNRAVLCPPWSAGCSANMHVLSCPPSSPWLHWLSPRNAFPTLGIWPGLTVISQRCSGRCLSWSPVPLPLASCELGHLCAPVTSYPHLALSAASLSLGWRFCRHFYAFGL